VISTGADFDERQEIYRWRFKETVLVEARGEPPASPKDEPAPDADQTAAVTYAEERSQ
jgi:hypothetical protein